MRLRRRLRVRGVRRRRVLHAAPRPPRRHRCAAGAIVAGHPRRGVAGADPRRSGVRPAVRPAGRRRRRLRRGAARGAGARGDLRERRAAVAWDDHGLPAALAELEPRVLASLERGDAPVGVGIDEAPAELPGGLGVAHVRDGEAQQALVHIKVQAALQQALLVQLARAGEEWMPTAEHQHVHRHPRGPDIASLRVALAVPR
mmetsp:Transcript_26474/g.76468  ORF Transcript_26474/g.76468 Transcript_26474/m.76468 type:complete len:201 (+) Transcript_26474:910-1512(+)